MEVDRSLETFLVPKSASIALELLHNGFEAFGMRVGRAGNDGRQDALEMSLDRSGHLLDRLESRANRPPEPFHPVLARSNP